MNPLISIGIIKICYIKAHAQMQAFRKKNKNSFIKVNLLLLATNLTIISFYK